MEQNRNSHFYILWKLEKPDFMTSFPPDSTVFRLRREYPIFQYLLFFKFHLNHPPNPTPFWNFCFLVFALFPSQKVSNLELSFLPYFLFWVTVLIIILFPPPSVTSRSLQSQKFILVLSYLLFWTINNQTSKFLLPYVEISCLYLNV